MGRLSPDSSGLLWIPSYRGPAPILGGFFVGATLVVALLSVDFPKSTVRCRDMNLDLQVDSILINIL